MPGMAAVVGDGPRQLPIRGTAAEEAAGMLKLDLFDI